MADPVALGVASRALQLHNVGAAKAALRNLRNALPPRPLARQVYPAASVTLTSSTSASSMSSPLFVPGAYGSSSAGIAGSANTDAFSFFKGQLAVSLTSGVSWANTTVNSAGNTSACSSAAAFHHTGQTCEIVLSQTSTFYIIKIDDQYLSLTPVSTGTTAAGKLWLQLAFATSARRRIEVSGYNLTFLGVNIGQTDSIAPAPVRGPKVIVLGDSMTAGSGASGAAANNFVQHLADYLGWDDVTASGLGGTGLVATNAGAAINYAARVQHDVIAPAPDLVLVCCSVNDRSTPAATVIAAAAALAQTIQAALPNVALGFFPDTSGGVNTESANALAIKYGVRALTAQIGALWIDPTEHPLPAGVTPRSGTFLSSYSAGQAGSSGINLYGYVAPGATITLGSGATLERVQVTGISQLGNNTINGVVTPYYKVLFDGQFQYAHPSGEAWTQSGGSYLTGHGNKGAQTGYGSADPNVSADGIHPTDAGHLDMGQDLAAQLVLAAQSITLH